MLMKNQSSVVLSLDPDLKSKALKIAKSLYQAGCNVKICFADPGSDMGSSTKQKNKKMISEADLFTPYSHLSHKINSIRSGSII